MDNDYAVLAVHHRYVVEFDCTTSTWDIYYYDFHTGLRRFISDHYDFVEACDICELRNRQIKNHTRSYNNEIPDNQRS